MSVANHDFDLLKLVSLIGFFENEKTTFEEATLVLGKVSSNSWRSIITRGLRHHHSKTNDVDSINTMVKAINCISDEQTAAAQESQDIIKVNIVNSWNRVYAIKSLKYKIISYCDTKSWGQLQRCSHEWLRDSHIMPVDEHFPLIILI